MTMVVIRSKVNWSELPPELLSMIGKSLDSSIDILRFRSVCSSWRSSTSPFHHSTDHDLPLPLKFPCPFASGKDAFVSESTIYRLEPLHEDDPKPSSSTSVPAKACLVKVEETKSGNYPLCIRRIDGSASPIPKVLSLLDYRMVELGKSNALNYLNGNCSMRGVSKVIRYPDTASISSEDCSIFVIYDGGKLGFAKYGDQKLTLVDDRISDYNDVIVYRGQPYVVDRWGTVSWIDHTSLKLTQFSPTSFGSGGRKHLVESRGELYVVDRYLDSQEKKLAVVEQISHRPHRDFIHRRLRRINTANRSSLPEGKAVDFIVYKLDQEWGKWVEVTDLGSEAFYLNEDMSFSVSASEFEGCKGNCIYYKNQFDSSLFTNARVASVFNLEDRSIGTYHWPRPLCFSNQHLNRRLWIMDCSIKPPTELLTPTVA
ncbi:hypothetical protein FNV43_RR18657 [Rhamnella rubrinervis]|uniref:F-box domain-containing protein n=1 Tax=Rhamnella rubrinervis TaxID=2594499 RepID=A0A8K0E5H9_9ROSA|nr:hypothetical protein FNV43_RR18657 [Rhamnella rubrinervis]